MAELFRSCWIFFSPPPPFFFFFFFFFLSYLLELRSFFQIKGLIELSDEIETDSFTENDGVTPLFMAQHTIAIQTQKPATKRKREKKPIFVPLSLSLSLSLSLPLSFKNDFHWTENPKKEVKRKKKKVKHFIFHCIYLFWISSGYWKKKKWNRIKSAI